MSQSTDKVNEIDLFGFFSGLGRWFVNLGKGLIGAIAGMRRLFFRNKLFFTGTVLAGLVIGLIYGGVFKKKFYQSSMIVSCDYLNNQILTNSVSKLNLLCQEQDMEGLAQVLNLPVATAKKIRRFNAKPFVPEQEKLEMEILKEQLLNVAKDKRDLVDKVVHRIEIGNSHAFLITVQLYDPSITTELQSALVQFFKGNEYIKRRIDANFESLLERRSKLKSEINKLDSLKDVIFQNFQSLSKQSKEGSNNVILGDKYLTDPIEVYKQDLDLYAQLQQVENAIRIRPEFELVDGLTPFREPESSGLLVIEAISFAVSIAMAYLLIGLYHFDRYLKNYNA